MTPRGAVNTRPIRSQSKSAAKMPNQAAWRTITCGGTGGLDGNRRLINQVSGRNNPVTKITMKRKTTSVVNGRQRHGQYQRDPDRSDDDEH